MRRYQRRRAPHGGARRYCRPWACPIVTSVDYVVSPNLERALARGRVRKALGRYGDVSLILKAVWRGETQTVLHVVISRAGMVTHIGVKGIRGWDPLNPSRVELPREWVILKRRKN